MLKRILPPPKWRFPVMILAGIFIGMAIFTIYLSKAHSYLSDDAQTCVNCHIMSPQYATWSHSSHREAATCNDCHVPQNNIFNHYYFKAKDGMRHATMFTLRLEPQVIHIKTAGAKAVHNNCLHCHENLIRDAKVEAVNPMHQAIREGRRCVECHREVPHGRVNSLSSVPYARVPTPESPVPQWMRNLLKNN